MQQKPSIGRIILVTLFDSAGRKITRPGIITSTWGDSPCVQATVFPDPGNDRLDPTMCFSSLPFDGNPCASAPSWNWPSRETPVLGASLESIRPKIDWVSLAEAAYQIGLLAEKLPASDIATLISERASKLNGDIKLASIA